ncbi:MAG: hypothetical protein U9P72_07865 [Campylobacterota bacterium]|nr:hypothetical protein [Campylobacterota bacterium]
MKLLLIMLLSIVSLNANIQNQVSSDTKLLIELIKSETKVNRELIKSETKANRDLLNVYREESNKRFEQADKRFDTLVYLLVGGFTLIMGYLLKERNSIKHEVIRELEPQLIKKADKNILDEVVSVIEEMAKNDKVMQEILKKHHFKIIN